MSVCSTSLTIIEIHAIKFYSLSSNYFILFNISVLRHKIRKESMLRGLFMILLCFN